MIVLLYARQVMNDFKSYSDDKKRNTYAQNGAQTPREQAAAAGDNERGANGGTPEQLNATVEMAKIITKAMNGKSTAQILQTIISEAERGKREGTLTNADLDNFYAVLSPILDSAKRRRLKEVIARLKSI